MEVVLELDQLVPAGERPSEANRHLHGLGTRAGESHSFCGGDQALNQPAPLDLQLVARAKMRAPLDLIAHRSDDVRVGMTEQQGTVPAYVIDDLVAIDIPFVTSRGPVDEDREGGRMARIVRDAARENLKGFAKQGLRRCFCS
jgi:hypothetical protein